MMKSLQKVFGSKHDRDMKKYRPMIQKINDLEAKIKPLSDVQLQAKTPEFKQRIANGESLDSIMPEAFAVCREAAWRRLQMRHYDVQLIGGLVLNKGSIAEMRTGEGKTLVATLPTYLNALSGKGAHVVTVNDYLAQRDCEWMGEVYRWLGLTTGTIVHGITDRDRQAAYGADITYGTNNEFGFDYLRDNMKFDIADYVQRPHNFAIVDECDSILIDEARTPLIISGPSDDETDKYHEINKIIPYLKKDVHFTMEEKSKTASLTEEGNDKVEELLGINNLFEPQNIQLLHHIYQGLKAYHLFHKDVDYMVKDGEIVIVDEFTGRLMPGRSWSDGLHQAIEAKEGVHVKGENQTLASITFQNYFRMYNKLSGMTGTAETEAVEFKKIYDLDVLVIPTNKPIARLDKNDVIYKNEQAKFKAIAQDVKARHETGQPVLIGTVSIERSEKLSRMLKHEGVTHNVLNAKQHEKEAEIVSQAGRKGSITIATNMAGRGTDIVLGGNAEAMANAARQEAWDDERFEEEVKKYEGQCATEKEEVLAAGGLYVVGTERHETRRIDNQLRGRSGRQGDPGESRFYLSLEDDLMRIFNGERLQKIMETLNVPDDEPIISKMVSRSIEGAQRKVEGHHFDVRKHLLEYDDVMNKQRTSIYDLRRKVLEGDDIGRVTLDMLGDVTSNILDTFVHEEAKAEDFNFEGLNTALAKQFGLKIDFDDTSKMSANQVTDVVSQAVKAAFDSQKETIGEFFTQAQKMILLQVIDTRWKEHLAAIDQIKEGINLRAFAQKDPLIEYKKEGFRLFESLNEAIKSESIEQLFKIQLVSENEEQMMRQREQDLSQLDYSGANDSDLSGGVNMSDFASEQPPAGSPMLGGSQQQPANGPTMNRAERRRLKNKKNKRR